MKDVVEQLLYAWGNEGWAANTDYAAAVMSEALHTSGPILECGSGATTVLLGLVAEQTGSKVLALEHLAEWAEVVKRVLRRFRIETVQVVLAPLAKWTDYEWYDVDERQLPDAFSLVVCDGPPDSTEAGRFGLVPRMQTRLPTNSVILLDDMCRDSERQVLERWRTLMRFREDLADVPHPFERLRVEGDPSKTPGT